MPGHHRTDRRRCADLLSRVAAMVWLITALAVLQWSAPTLDPGLFQRLASAGAGDAGLAIDDRTAPAVVEARSAPAVTVAEKRASGPRLPAGGADAPAIPAAAVAAPRTAGFSTTVPATPVGPRRAAAGRAFTARSPPVPA